MKKWMFLVVLFPLSIPSVYASDPRPMPESARHFTSADPLDAQMIQAGFLSSHPDLRYRILGMNRYKDGKHEDALKFFRRAAYYADKPSQAMVAEMLWNGEGGLQDRALAYAWMDLAAERGYPELLGMRERYWAGLDENARERALALGQEAYAQYGDAAAKPRIATVLRRESRKATGSRTGFVGNLQLVLPDGQTIDGSKFYDPQFWDPEKYQAWHDNNWESKMRVGKVHASGLQSVQNDLPEVKSRVPETSPDDAFQEPEVPEEESVPGG